MAKTKIDKEAIKEHMEVDELEVYIEKIIKWITSNVNTIIIVAIIAILTVLGVTYFRSQKESKLEEAQSILDDTIRYYNSLITENDNKKAEELYTQISENSTSLMDAFKDSVQAAEALFLKGKALLYQNKFDDALKIFDEFIALSKQPEDKARGYLAKGYALENKAFINDDKTVYEESIKNYNQAAELGENSYIRLEALYNIGKIYKNLGNKDLALQTFEKITMSKLALDKKSWGAPEGSSGFVAKAEEERKELTGK